MTKDRNPLKAGLFILACVALVIGVVFAIQGTGQIFHPTRLMTAAFDLDENLGGLKEGDPVRIGGFDQGRVTNIYLVPQSGPKKVPQFLVTFTLPTTYEIHSNAVVQLEQGLTGAANLNFTSFGTGPAYADGQPLDGTPSSISQLYAIAPQASKFLARLEGKIDPAYDKYDHVMTSADAALQTGHEAMAQVRDILGESKFDLRTTIANLQASTATIKTRLPTTLDRVDGFLDTTRETIASAHDTLADIRAAAASTKDITAEARSLVFRNKSKIDHMIDSFRNTSSNLEGASVEIRHSPWRLLYHPSNTEVQNINVIDTAREFAEGASQVNDAAAAVRDALKDAGVDKARLQQLMDALNSSFDHYGHVEDALWKAVK